MRMLVFLICLLKPLVHGDVFESEQPVPNRIPISLTAQARATGTHGLSSGITPSQTPTLGGVAERYGASTSASRLGGHGAPHQGTSQLGSISEHQASHASGVSGGRVGVMSKAPGAEDLGLLRAGQSPYDPRAMESILHQRYGADAVSSSTLLRGTERNVRLAGQRHPVTGIVFDMKGTPIFDDVAVFEVRLSKDVALGCESDIHKITSTKILAESLSGNPILKAQFNSSQLAAIAKGKKTIPGFTWHHHQDIGRMQLVPKDIHKYTGHVGEGLWQRGLDNAK
jgi:hypothetical protein